MEEERKERGERVDGATPVVILACERPSGRGGGIQGHRSSGPASAPAARQSGAWTPRPGVVGVVGGSIRLVLQADGVFCGSGRCSAEPLTRLRAGPGPSRDVPLGAEVPCTCTCRGWVGPAVSLGRGVRRRKIRAPSDHEGAWEISADPLQALESVLFPSRAAVDVLGASCKHNARPLVVCASTMCPLVTACH